MNERQIACKYSPVLLMDRHEPFRLKAVGYSVMTEEGMSPSFRRKIVFDDNIRTVIEYAYYWDYDIQHLYDLEHIWVYLDAEGTVINCEGSFHGKYFKVLLRDRSNLEGACRVRVFCQPGKHAFSALREFFELHPTYDRCTTSEAGREGLCDTPICEGRVSVTPEEEKKVKAFMISCAFVPAEEYLSFYTDEAMIFPWETLYEHIPTYIKAAVDAL